MISLTISRRDLKQEMMFQLSSKLKGKGSHAGEHEGKSYQLQVAVKIKVEPAKEQCGALSSQEKVCCCGTRYEAISG